MNNSLLLIDFQNDYFPGGKMELVGIDDAAANAQKLLNEFRKSQSPVIHIQHLSSRPRGNLLPAGYGRGQNPSHGRPIGR